MSNTEQKLSIQTGYVLVERPPGYEVVLREQLARLRELSALCEQADSRKVLVVGEGTNVRLSPEEIFSLGEQLAELGLQVAVVESHNALNADVRFLEDVTTNRGGPIRFFEEVEAAKEWLGVE